MKIKLTALGLIITLISLSSFKPSSTEPVLHESKMYVGENLYKIVSKEKMANWAKETSQNAANAKIMNTILKKYGKLPKELCLGGWNSADDYCFNNKNNKSVSSVTDFAKFTVPITSQWWCLYDCATGVIVDSWWATRY